MKPTPSEPPRLLPSLHLKGGWLEEAGFTTVQAVNITVEQE
ncbi:SymE family type I addiction module toxin [Photorhabdus sp. SF281]